MAEEFVLEFDRGAGAKKLQHALDEIVAELRTPGSEAAEAAQAVGVEEAELKDITLVASEKGQAMDPLTAAILITVVGNFASDRLDELWDEVIWPRLKFRLGAKAVGKKRKTGKRSK